MKNILKMNLTLLLIAVVIISVIGTVIVLTTESYFIRGVRTGLLSGAGDVNITVNETTSVTLTVSDIDFGDMFPSTDNNTTNEAPGPFVVENDGNVIVDISIKMNASLFSGTGAGNNTTTFQYKVDNCSAAVCGAAETDAFDWNLSETNWTNFTDADLTFLYTLEFDVAVDEAEIDILINIPADEQEGIKSSFITFTATKA